MRAAEATPTTRQSAAAAVTVQASAFWLMVLFTRGSTLRGECRAVGRDNHGRLQQVGQSPGLRR